MKEILKYLRQTNSFTQEEIAQKLEISRQSYIKYENGDVEPNDKIVRKLAIIYDVREDFIRKNEVPVPGKKKDFTYNFAEPPKHVSFSEPTASYGPERLPDGRRIFEGIFDGSVVRILDSIEGLHLKKGQKIKLFLEDEREERKRKEKAYKTIMSFVKKGKPCTLAPDEDPYYKEMLYEALEEKYGPFN